MMSSSSAAAVRCDRARARQRRQVLGGRSQHAQRQAGAARGDRRQHRVQPDAELTGAETRQLAVDPWLRLVEAAPGRQRETLRQPADRRFVGESNRAAAQTVSVVDPHRVRRGDEHVGGAVARKQRLENAGSGQLGLQHPQTAQHLGCRRARHRTPRGSPSATTLGRSGPDSAARRSRTRSISDALMPRRRRMLVQHREHTSRSDCQRRSPTQSQTAAFERIRHTRLRPHRRQQRQSHDLVRPRPTADHPATGPRTTTPALGLAGDTHGAIAAAAAHERTSAGAITTTRSADVEQRLRPRRSIAAARRRPRWRRRDCRRR